MCEEQSKVLDRREPCKHCGLNCLRINFPRQLCLEDAEQRGRQGTDKRRRRGKRVAVIGCENPGGL